MSLKFYYDLMSQPSRALYIFLKLAKIPFEPCPVALRKGEHLTEEFKEKNRFQKVPFIHHGDFKLSESVAIVRYLAREFKLDTSLPLYPKESKEQAKVDEYLEWQHNNIRANCALYFQSKWLMPILTGKEPNPNQISKLEERMNGSLDIVENVWLKNTPFIAGHHVTFADIIAACEIEQPRMGGFEPREGRPILSAWLNRVQTETAPFYDEAHTVLNKIALYTAQKEAKAKL